MIRRCVAAVAAVFALTGHAQAIEVTRIERPGPLVIRVEVNYGLLDSCGQRETPHLIEHLVLSETFAGATGPDLMANLWRSGISLDAVTRQDFTEFTLEGPASEAALMAMALTATLGRPNLPESAFDREIEAIRLELKAEPGFASKPAEFETFTAKHIVGAPLACTGEEASVEMVPHAGIQEAFKRAYVSENLALTVVGPANSIDAHALARQLENSRGHGQATVRKVTSSADPVDEAVIIGESDGDLGYFEARVVIPGRQGMNSAKAAIYAETLRLAMQAVLRKDAATYHVTSVVQQSNSAGWISLVADVHPTKAAFYLDPVRETIDREWSRMVTEGVAVYGDSLNNRDIAKAGYADIDGALIGPAKNLTTVTKSVTTFAYIGSMPSNGFLKFAALGLLLLASVAIWSILNKKRRN